MTEENFSSIRPSFLNEYIGQKEIKKQIKVFIEAAKKKNKTLDHTLLCGPPGLGKTTLASIIANELQKNLVITTGSALNKKGDIAGILTSLKEGDVLFIDEIHRINRAIEELLYPAMEDFKIDIVVGKNRSAKSIRLSLPEFTLIGATTRAGMLSSPLLSRFGIILNFDFYDEKSLSEIVKKTAKKLNIKISDDAAMEIAKRSRGTPRIANNILKRVNDYCIVHGENFINLEICKDALLFLGIDEYGLNQKDIFYLKTIVEKFENKPVGIKTLSSAINEEVDVIEEVIEPYLIRIGFLKKTSKGRVATQKAIQHLNGRSDRT